MSKLTIRGDINLSTTPPNGDGDAVLARDSSSGNVGLNTTALSTVLTSGQIIVGNASNQAAAVTPTGDVTISNTGVTSIGTGVIVNADINATAAIALSKLAALTVSRAIVSDGSGVLSASAVTSTELGYVSGVTSAIQTQLNSKQATITGAATTVVSVNLTSNRAVISGATGKIEVSSVTSTELGYVSGVTSAIQTQLNARLSVSLTSPATGDIIYYNGTQWVNLARGSNGQTLQSTATSIQWGTPTVNGIPSGGTAKQVLAKTDGTDFNATWYTLDISYIPTITASAAELNIMDGVTATTAEINLLSGASGNIQSQLNNKLSTGLASNNIYVGNGSGVATATTDLPTGTTIGSAAIYRVGGSDVTLADGGTGVSLADPGANAIFVWDDTLNQTRLSALSGLSYNSGTNTLTVSATSAGAWALTGTSTITTPTIVGNPFFEGNVLIGATGATITANTPLDVRGLSGGNALRVANSTNTARLTILDTGVTVFNGPTGSSLAHIFTVQRNGVNSMYVYDDGSFFPNPSHRISNTDWIFQNNSGTILTFSASGPSAATAALSGLLVSPALGNNDGTGVESGVTNTLYNAIPTVSYANAFNGVIRGYSFNYTNNTIGNATIRAYNSLGGLTRSTGSASFTVFTATPTFNTTGTYAGTAIGFDYNPTETSVTGLTHYAFLNRSTTALSGFATASPVSTLETARSFGANTTSVSADTTLDVSHYTVRVDATGAGRTITLPAASGCTRRIYIVKKIDSSVNTVTIDGNGAETIDGAATKVISTQYAGYVIQSNGTNWDVIGTF